MELAEAWPNEARPALASEAPAPDAGKGESVPVMLVPYGKGPCKIAKAMRTMADCAFALRAGLHDAAKRRGMIRVHLGGE